MIVKKGVITVTLEVSIPKMLIRSEIQGIAG